MEGEEGLDELLRIIEVKVKGSKVLP